MHDHFDALDKSCYEHGCTDDCPVGKALVLKREVARARRPSYLEITAVLAAVGAIGTWFGAMLL